MEDLSYTGKKSLHTTHENYMINLYVYGKVFYWRFNEHI